MFLAIAAFVLTIDTAAGAAPSIAADGETLALLASKVVIDTGSSSTDLLASIANLVQRVEAVEVATAAADHSTVIEALQKTVDDNKAECASAAVANEGKIKALEDSEKQRVLDEAQEDTDEDAQEKHFAALQNQVEAAVARFDNVDVALNSTAEDVEGVAAELGAEVDSLEARLTWLLDDYVDSKSDLLSEMIVGGDLEDENGDIAHTEGLTKKGGALRDNSLNFDDYFKLVVLPEDERPDGKDHLGNQLKHAVKFTPRVHPTTGARLDFSYPIARSREHKQAHPQLCPGVYRFRIWLRYDDDYDGYLQFLHLRFLVAGAACGGETKCEAFSQSGGSRSNIRRLAAAGQWPAKANEWKLVELGFKLQRRAIDFNWYIGYPSKGTAGSVHFTGMSVTRLGGDGSCAE